LQIVEAIGYFFPEEMRDCLCISGLGVLGIIKVCLSGEGDLIGFVIY
jgi:hypothetical protein